MEYVLVSCLLVFFCSLHSDALLCYNSSMAQLQSTNESNPATATTCVLALPSDVILPYSTRQNGLKVIFHNPYSTSYLDYGRLLHSADFRAPYSNGIPHLKSGDALIRLSRLEILICEDENAPSGMSEMLGMASVTDLFHPQPVRIKQLQLVLGDRKSHSSAHHVKVESNPTRMNGSQKCIFSHSFQGTLLQDVVDLQTITFHGVHDETVNGSSKSCLTLEGVLLDAPFDYHHQQNQNIQSSSDNVGFSSISIENIHHVDWAMNNSRWLQRCGQKSFLSFNKKPWIIRLHNVDEMSFHTALGLLHVAKYCPQIQISIPSRIEVVCTCQFLREWGKVQNRSKQKRIQVLSESIICTNLDQWVFMSTDEPIVKQHLTLSQIYTPLTCHP